jgi:hypothetical protein
MAGSSEIEGIGFVDYVDEGQLDDVMALVGRDLSEPYSSKYERQRHLCFDTPMERCKHDRPSTHRSLFLQFSPIGTFWLAIQVNGAVQCKVQQR